MNRIAYLVLGSALVCLNGCKGEAPDIVEVSGTVTHNGKPVPNLMIYFSPTNGRPSWGHSNEQGRFTLDYDLDYDGAKVGTHTVYVADGAMTDPTMRQLAAAGPKKYPELSQI